MVTVRCGARWFMVNAGHSRLTLTVAAGSGFTAAAAAVAVFMARQSAACLSLQAADSERCLFGGDCCHSIRHLCAVPGYMRQTIRRCTVRLQKLYRQTSDVVPSDLATLYRRHTSGRCIGVIPQDAVPSDLGRCTVRPRDAVPSDLGRCTVIPQTQIASRLSADNSKTERVCE